MLSLATIRQVQVILSLLILAASFFQFGSTGNFIRNPVFYYLLSLLILFILVKVGKKPKLDLDIIVVCLVGVLNMIIEAIILDGIFLFFQTTVYFGSFITIGLFSHNALKKYSEIKLGRINYFILIVALMIMATGFIQHCIDLEIIF